MREKRKKCPAWSEKALQGLAFWIGHRQALYGRHKLLEGAIVAETCNLIYANLQHDKEELLCEQQYSYLVPSGTWPTRFGPKSRADLVVIARTDEAPETKAGGLKSYAQVVIEIKRALAPLRKINDDLKRLAAFKAANSEKRAFLFLVSEAELPNQFVNNKGRAITGEHIIPKTNSYYVVRRVCKAASSFERICSSHYACVIEVFNSGDLKKTKTKRKG